MARTDIAGGAFYHADVRVGRIETAERGRTQSMRRSSGWSRTLRVTRFRRRLRVGWIETAGRGRSEAIRRSSGWSRTLRVTRFRRRVRV